jgi:hypothetical protein
MLWIDKGISSAATPHNNRETTLHSSFFGLSKKRDEETKRYTLNVMKRCALTNERISKLKRCVFTMSMDMLSQNYVH